MSTYSLMIHDLKVTDDVSASNVRDYAQAKGEGEIDVRTALFLLYIYGIDVM